MEQNNKPERSMGSAVGIFFLTWILVIVGANTVLMVQYGVTGASFGGIIPIGTAIVLAVVWKNGSINTLPAAIIAYVVGVVACLALLPLVA